ncbi:hypothetical protein ABC733_17050 [Mangrovibacter sp. SLW1]
MATNDFKPFAIGSGANVTAQADWEALAALATGFQSGVAKSAQVNKALRQGSVMAYLLGQFIADQAEVDAADDGDTATLLTNFVAALKAANESAGFLNKSNNLSDVASVSESLANLGLGTNGIVGRLTGSPRLLPHPKHTSQRQGQSSSLSSNRLLVGMAQMPRQRQVVTALQVAAVDLVLMPDLWCTSMLYLILRSQLALWHPTQIHQFSPVPLRFVA